MLSDAILEIAQQMETEAELYDGDSDGVKSQEDGGKDLKAFARQLRSAVKASIGINLNPNPVMTTGSLVLPSFGESIQRQKELQERSRKEEREGTRMVPLEYEGEENTLVDIDPSMPEEAKTVIGAKVFILRGGKLIYSPEETQKYLTQS